MGAPQSPPSLGVHTVIEHVLQPLLQADLAAVAVVLDIAPLTLLP